MAASTIFFNGRVISIPGSYSEVDASGLEQVGLSAAGIVAVLGTAVGGTPAASLPEAGDFIRVKKPETGRELFRSGDLREVMDMLFAPGKDPDILGGAQEVVVMKTNPATQSTGVLPNATANCMDLTSSDYGAFTTQVNISVAAGTNKGKLITIIFEDDTIAGDDVGGDIMFNLKYVDSGDGWTTATAQVKGAGDVEVLGTRTALAGKDGDITVLGSNDKVYVVSTAAGDTTQTLTLWGLSAAGVAQSEVITLTGTTHVASQLTYLNGSNKVWGGKLSAACAGTVTVKDFTTELITVMSFAPATVTKGLYLGEAMYAASVISATVSGASTKKVILAGLSATGAAQLEILTLNAGGGVTGALVFSEIQHIIMGDVEAAQTVVYSGTIAKSLVTVQDTMQKVADYFNARAVTPVATTYGFIFTLVTGLTSFDPGDLDVASAVTNILSPLNPAFYADLWACIDWVNTNAQYMTAVASTGAKDGAPSNTAAPVFLSGGIEGSATSATYLAALNLLKKTRINSIVLLTQDAAVHADGDAHCAYMGGVGRSERDLFVGLLGDGVNTPPLPTTLSTKAEIKAQIIALNSRHTRAFAQSIERYNTAGVRASFYPHFQAAIAAGMQAGSPVGTPLTHKYANVLSIAQSTGATGWNPTDDSEEMIQAGLCFMENVEGVGRRIKRNITTYLISSNLAYIEGSVNEAVNYSVYNFRTNLEWAVGRKGFSGTVNATKSIATNTLGLLVGEEVLVAFQSLDVELIVDVMEVSVQIAPVLPINFVKSTIHLVTIPQVAA